MVSDYAIWTTPCPSKLPLLWWTQYEGQVCHYFRPENQHEDRIKHSHNADIRYVILKISVPWTNNWKSLLQSRNARLRLGYLWDDFYHVFLFGINLNFLNGSKYLNICVSWICTYRWLSWFRNLFLSQPKKLLVGRHSAYGLGLISSVKQSNKITYKVPSACSKL